MSNRFIKQLKAELPFWVERGWVSPGGDRAIMEHLAGQEREEGFLIHALAILGVLLLGSGVITFFAANWSEMAKLSKLAVLLGGLWLAYGTAGLLLTRGEHPRTGQALLLLGVILFGANVMLIAQIYHIEAHYPNGVLLWAVGALLTAFLLPSQPAMAAAIALLCLWTGMESLDFDRVHLVFLPLWAICLPRIHSQNWRFAFHLALIALLLWSLFTFFSLKAPSGLYLAESYALAYLALFLGGMLMETHGPLAPFAPIVKRYAIFAVLAGFYILTFPQIQSWDRGQGYRAMASGGWVLAFFALLGLVALLSLWHRQRTLAGQRPSHLIWGQLLIATGVVFLAANLFIGGHWGGLVALGFNLLYFSGLVWLIVAGRETNDEFLINIAFFFFTLALVSRYFDTFWSLMDRSFFFMGGGMLLLAGGFLLERQRRRLTRGVRGKREGAQS
ncbi:MAG: DUF2157 domain-containing protein [Gammaproteobacteria bacterium]|nr:DUF2157 domain-containing protein [Gammaproteobacteria bacterium]MBU1656174.1 DUF2157 domain-containing protein [Gammaproteobacteria bacterium]MBU1961307.1 DUF2157 domain-containing protein [Gammaproteobacteria bacterium]